MPLRSFQSSGLVAMVVLSIIVILFARETFLRYNNSILSNPVDERLKFLTLVCCLKVFPSYASPLTCAIIQQIRCKVSIASQRLMQRRNAVISMLSSNFG